MQGTDGLGCTQEPPHQEMDHKEPQPPTLGLEEEERGKERKSQMTEEGCEGHTK